MPTALLAFLALGCAPVQTVYPKNEPPAESKGNWATTNMGKRVLVLWNRQVPEGKELAEFYAQKRGVPPQNIFRINVLKDEDTSFVELNNNVFTEVRKKVASLGGPIDFILLCKGIPIRVYDDAHFSLDAYVSTMDMTIEPLRQLSGEGIKKLANPYFGKDEPFSKKKYGFYLVTRLDGYSFADAKQLVINSINAKPEKGPFLFDRMGGKNDAGRQQLEGLLDAAGSSLKQRGFEATVDPNFDYVKPAGPLAGYCGWGSNDPHFSNDTYQSLRFKPGAIAETFVSTSARTFRPTSGGQSLIVDLIKNGVTGVKGYVKEPYTFAMAQPQILFPRYTAGYTLAESFYMASPVIKWRDLIVGDPICAPYARSR